MMEGKWFQPAGDPYQYRFRDGDTVEFIGPDGKKGAFSVSELMTKPDGQEWLAQKEVRENVPFQTMESMGSAVDAEGLGTARIQEYPFRNLPEAANASGVGGATESAPTAFQSDRVPIAAEDTFSFVADSGVADREAGVLQGSYGGEAGEVNSNYRAPNRTNYEPRRQDQAGYGQFDPIASQIGALGNGPPPPHGQQYEDNIMGMLMKAMMQRGLGSR